MMTSAHPIPIMGSFPDADCTSPIKVLAGFLPELEMVICGSNQTMAYMS